MAFFDDLLNKIAATKQPSGEVWFRGQADDSWALVPRLLRSGISREHEKNMLARFRFRAMGMLEHPPADNDPARWLFLMQHHGLPTRLLDWSESALAALYFAVADKLDKDGKLYILVPMALNQQQIGERVLIPPTARPSSDIMLASFKGDAQIPPKIVAVSAYASNDRLDRQRGCFTVHGISYDLRTVAKNNVLRSIKIPSKSKSKLLEALAHFGITQTSLFHDLDALASEIRDQYGIS